MRILFLTGISIVLMFSACKHDMPNEKPKLDFLYTADALTVTISGTAIDKDGNIKNMIVDWGDSLAETLVLNETGYVQKSHHYSAPGNYTIVITATDNSNESSTQTFVTDLKFNITSLEGVKPGIFKTSAKEFLVLTLNLHTYQEKNQEEKINLIIDAIGMMDIDFVLFEECAQLKTASIVEGIIREDNMALILSKGVAAKYGVEYSFVWDWSHYGFDNWEEGVAVLSNHPLINTDNRYISTNTSKTSITSRKTIYGSYSFSATERLNMFDAHTHWRLTETDEEQNNQVKKLKLMVDEKEQMVNGSKVMTLIGCDLNGNPTSDYPWSEGYNTMVANNKYVDSYLKIYPDANTKPSLSIHNTVEGDFPGRIDYIFMKENPYLELMDSQIIFTNQVIGRVSDHYGVITKFRIID
jgi:maltose 6'-phosphate phosphatase